MNCKQLFLIVIILLHNSIVWCQNRIKINIPSVEEETNYIWRNIQDISFFEQHGYSLSLPKGEIIEELKVKSKNNQLVQQDFYNLLEFMTKEVYNLNQYQEGFKRIEEKSVLINKMVNKLSKCKRNWGFKEFEIYQINLTLYGPGGSYNPENGSILIFTTQQGQFKQYENPSNTIIHEIIHIGIEESIINKFQVPHPLKERIVDLFVQLNFKKYLPEYRIQNMGDKRIDTLLGKKRNLKNLDKIINEFMSKYK